MNELHHDPNQSIRVKTLTSKPWLPHLLGNEFH